MKIKGSQLRNIIEEAIKECINEGIFHKHYILTFRVWYTEKKCAVNHANAKAYGNDAHEAFSHGDEHYGAHDAHGEHYGAHDAHGEHYGAHDAHGEHYSSEEQNTTSSNGNFDFTLEVNHAFMTAGEVKSLVMKEAIRKAKAICHKRGWVPLRISCIGQKNFFF